MSPSMPVEVVGEEVFGVGVAVAGVTDEGLGNTSWVLAVGAQALVVDPERDPAPYRSVAGRLGAEVAYSADTHLHADFVTGTPELAAVGAAALAPSGCGIEWDHRAMAPGGTIEVGGWLIEALPTPGHTPEHVAYLASDDRGPRAVFTGGSLLVGSVARTDLIDPADTEALTRALWRSINHRLLELGDDVVVLPTHGAGSFCSASGGSRRWTTIGEERRSNPLLAAPDEDAFVHAVLSGLGTYPPYFLRLRDLNRRGPKVYGSLPALAALPAAAVERLRAQGGVIVDVRPVADYAAGHIPGALANTLRAQFASWLGWLVSDPSLPLVFVTDDNTDHAELVRQCLNIGYENLAGTLAGGIEAWGRAGGEVVATPLVDPSAGAVPAGATVLDVRQAPEVAGGRVPGAVAVELGTLVTVPLGTSPLVTVPLGTSPLVTVPLGASPLVTMCGHGERAATAASLLEAGGRRDVAIAVGGPADWAAAAGSELE